MNRTQILRSDHRNRSLTLRGTAIYALIAVASCSVPDSGRFVDHMEGYYDFFELADRDSGVARISRFKEMVLTYDLSTASSEAAVELTPERATEWNVQIQRLIDLHSEIRTYHALAMTELPMVSRAVADALDAGVYDIPVHLTITLQPSHGQIRHVDGRYVVTLGIDALARDDEDLFAGSPLDVRPRLAHEYFHAWHLKLNPYLRAYEDQLLRPSSASPPWMLVWFEGLAVCFSRFLYPDASLDRVLLADGRWRQVEAQVPVLARSLLAAGDTPGTLRLVERFAGTGAWNATHSPVPSVLGAVVADQIVSQIGFHGAAALEGRDLRGRIEAALSDIAAGHAQNSQSSVCSPGRDRPDGI